MSREQLGYLLRLVKGGMLERATTIIEQELAKPEQEPVAWVTSTASGYNTIGYDSSVINQLSDETLLYTASPRKPWVGLTDDEIHSLWLSNHSATKPSPFSRVIEAKIKELNT